MRQQRTLRHVIGCAGVGLHSGARVGLTLCPAAESSGVQFRRVDRPGSPAIPARLDHVGGTDLVTSLRDRRGGGVRMIEHLMAALVACEIDNVLVEITGPEVPAMDGSARPFVLLMECAGTVAQAKPAARLELLRALTANSVNGHARLEPAAGLELVLKRGSGDNARRLAFTFSPDACKRELVAARDGAGGPASGDCHADEALRHAALDVLGDLALIPARLQARYTESGADPALRRSLLRQLLSDPGNWRVTGGGVDLTTTRGATMPLAYAS
jgi:UDP-3-O-[3-hydroxymyristoyl] N-acetylglucosamine deacetylase